MAKKRGRKKKMYESTPEIKTLANCATNFKLTIPDDIYQKIAYWLRKTANEVSGFGSLEWDAKSATYTVKDVILLKQEVGRASTEIDPVALGKAMFEMKDEPLGLKWHWHTHPNMGVFWSGDDMEIIRSLGQQGWIIASVFNEKGEVKSAFYTKTRVMDQDHDIFRDNLPTEIVRFMPTAFFRALDDEYDKHVSESVYKPVHYVGSGIGGLPRVGGSIDPELQALTEDVPTIHSSRWMKDGTELNYSTYGYANKGDYNWIYNPLHDAQLQTEEERLDAIAEMEDSEITWLELNDTRFAALLSRYLLREAGATTGGELWIPS